MGLFDGISKFFGTSNESSPGPSKDFTQSQYFDPYAFQFGNYGANNYAQGKSVQANQIDRRSAPQADYAQANADAARALQARGQQSAMAGQMAARARGLVPSIAGMQAQQDMQAAAASQASAAASAQGPAALALAQQNAANNTANAQGQISGQAQINAANERLAAEQAAYGAYSGMRGQDYGAQGQNAQQAQYQAGLQMQSRQANDARAMGYEQMGQQALLAEQQGRLQQQGLLAGGQGQTNAINAQVAGQNAGMNAGYLMGTMKLGEGVAGAAGNLSDARAKQGAYPLGGGLMMSDVTSKVGLAQLGGPNATMSPMSGPAGAPAGVGAGGMNVMDALRQNANVGTQFVGNPTGMGSGGGGGLMLSDDRAKLRDAERQAYLLGRAHGVERNADFAYGGAPRQDEEIVDRDPWQSEARRGEVPAEWLSQYMGQQGQGGGTREAGDFYGAQPAMAGAAGSTMTGHLAQGLAPYAYEYKPGFGTPGEKVGPMAQEMAANPVTATAVRQDPSNGLLSIDRDDGLKVALGGVGHLAAKQAEQQQALDDLLYAAHARRQRRGF